MTKHSKKQNNKQLIEAVDHLFTTISPGELSVALDHFMGSAIRDDLNNTIILSDLWNHYEELRDFVTQIMQLYKERTFTS